MYVAAGTVTLSTDFLGAPAGPNYGVSENAALGGADPKGLLQYGNGNGGALYVAGGSVTLTNDYVIANIAEGYEVPGSYTGGISIAAGATVVIDSFTVNGTYWNATINEVDQTSPYDAQIVGPYTLLP